jgi:hypothetical protein
VTASLPARRTTRQRGYGADHQRERRRWQAVIDAGHGHCWRCHKPIPPGTRTWDLGHDDHDRTRYRGPECRPCNRAAGARKTNAIKRARRARTVRTRLTW